MSAKPSSKLVQAVAKVLWEQWDPIGVNLGVPHGADRPDVWTDEYDGYAASVAALLRSGADAARVAQHLSHLTKDNMGLVPDRTRDAAVAAVLCDQMKARA